MAQESRRESGTGQNEDVVDAVVVGAGFGGIRALIELTAMNLTVKAFEAGSGVGGTWYWNRYPGARTDSEAWGYCYYFSKQLRQEWQWSERLPSQAEVLRYLEYVTDRLGLRQYISFNSRVTSAVFDETTNLWTVDTANGEKCRCRYFVTAVGVLSMPKRPEFPGVDRFKGELYSAPLWPKEPVDLTGKRVAIIGSAATAVQILPIVAKVASHVSIFQRTPSYVLPGRNYAIGAEELSDLRKRSDAIVEQTRTHAFGLPLAAAGPAHLRRRLGGRRLSFPVRDFRRPHRRQALQQRRVRIHPQ
jgi:cyclohexanone monooxygenase